MERSFDFLSINCFGSALMLDYFLFVFKVILFLFLFFLVLFIMICLLFFLFSMFTKFFWPSLILYFKFNCIFIIWESFHICFFFSSFLSDKSFSPNHPLLHQLITFLLSRITFFFYHTSLYFHCNHNIIIFPLTFSSQHTYCPTPHLHFFQGTVPFIIIPPIIFFYQ